MIQFVNLHSSLILLVVSVTTIIAFTFNCRRWPPRGSGPTPLPFIGNALQIDASKPWVTYTNWAARYGDVFMFRVFKQDIIVISSAKIAKEVFERRSRIYSDRPYIATREPFGHSFNFGLAPYGDAWRSQRKIFHQAFRAEAAVAFRPLQMRKARDLVLDILRSPSEYDAHLQRFSAALILSIVYDYEVAPQHDHLVELLERGNALVVEGLSPEVASMVDAFPFVLGLPEWFPGGGLGRRARVSKQCAMRMVAEPFEYARNREAEGSSASAMALDRLRNNKEVDDPSRLELLKNTCATAFFAGTETTTATLHCFLLAMYQHPEVQKRAQIEIETVVGTARLPNFDDRPNLPYVEAILLETLRLYAVAPLGLPHATTADDTYEGIFIPKGSTVFANIWAMHHNEEVYPEPDAFKPERFLKDGKLMDEKSVNSLAFGFGRRVCPGRYAADGSTWAVMVSILSSLKITKAYDEQGKETDCDIKWTTGLMTAPLPFPCSLSSLRPEVDMEKLLKEDL